MTTPGIIEQYRALGWVFKQVSWPRTWRSDSEEGGVGGGGACVEVAYYYTSPRMAGAQGIIKDGFDEDHLLREESEYYARQIHGASVFASVNSVSLDVIRQLGTIYRLRDRGKIIPMPEVIMVHDLAVKVGPAA